MAALIPSLDKESLTASLMSFGYDPDLMSRDPYEGAKGAVREALAKFACLGGDYRAARLSLQEYFARPETPEGWGKPAAALLGALEAQLRLGVPAVGGKDSMSGGYRDPARGIDLAVPPTLAAFAAGTCRVERVRSGALSGEPGNPVILFSQDPASGENPAAGGDRPADEWDLFKANLAALETLAAKGLVRAAYPVGPGGTAATLAVMAFGNMTGVEAYPAAFAPLDDAARQGSFLVELGDSRPGALAALLAGSAARWVPAALTLAEPVFRAVPSPGSQSPGGQSPAETPLAELRRAYESPLTGVYPQTSVEGGVGNREGAGSGEWGTGSGERGAGDGVTVTRGDIAEGRCDGVTVTRGGVAEGRCDGVTTSYSLSPTPLVVLPVFPGTNCEWDMERAFRRAGARTRLVIFRNRNPEDIRESIRELAAAIGGAQILALSGGFSAGDEPDGSGTFIANALRSPAVAEAARDLLERRDGLVLGICNGFQALIKLGLVPYGEYRAAAPGMPTLTFNAVGRHVSRMVRTRVMPSPSPWLALDEPGTVHVLPVSHGEGRVVIRPEEAEALFASGQVPFCYADASGRPALAEPDNPNGSAFAIEALTSPGGRVLGKMGHSERRGDFVHINIPGNKRQNIFEAGVRYLSCRPGRCPPGGGFTGGAGKPAHGESRSGRFKPLVQLAAFFKAEDVAGIFGVFHGDMGKYPVLQKAHKIVGDKFLPVLVTFNIVHKFLHKAFVRLFMLRQFRVLNIFQHFFLRRKMILCIVHHHMNGVHKISELFFLRSGQAAPV
jgi:phosphoribosylformylglycinamidine synthase